MQLLEEVPGVYRILNASTGDFYIGSTCNLRRRRNEHFRWLRAKKHCNPHLQRAWDLYGADKFTFEVVELCTRDAAPVREQHHLDTLKPRYNILTVVGDVPKGGGSPASIEAVRRHATGNTYRLGKLHTEETKALLKQRSTGKVASASTRRKMSVAHQGHEVSVAAREATATRNRAKEWTPTERLALSEAKRAKVTPEFRRTQAERATGVTATTDTRKKMSEAQKGRTHSAETKRKMAEARAKFWANKREEAA